MEENVSSAQSSTLAAILEWTERIMAVLFLQEDRVSLLKQRVKIEVIGEAVKDNESCWIPNQDICRETMKELATEVSTTLMMDNVYVRVKVCRVVQGYMSISFVAGQ
jgi:hypothetical protein